LGFLDFEKVANAFGFEYLELSKTDEIDSVLCDVKEITEPVLVNVIIPSDTRVIPQVKFRRANEDMEPLLSRELFNEAMIIPILSSSE